MRRIWLDVAVSPGTVAYRSDILKPSISWRPVPALVSSLTGEPDLQYLRRGMGIAPLLFQFQKSWLSFGSVVPVLLDLRLL